MIPSPLPLFADDHPSDEGFDHDLRQSLRHTPDPVARLALRVLEDGGSRDR